MTARGLVLLAAAGIGCEEPPAELAPLEVGERCGDCFAGRWDGVACVDRTDELDLEHGPAPADTGARAVFHTEDYGGADHIRIERAGEDAAEVGGAVVLDRVYEVSRTVELRRGVMYTGGGLRRACGAVATVTAAADLTWRCVEVDRVAGQERGRVLVNLDPSMEGTLGTFRVTEVDRERSRLCTDAPGLAFRIPAGARILPVFAMARTEDGDPASGVLVDGVLFDGAARCNEGTHDWRYNATYALRGAGHTVRRSVFRDTPSENLMVCGADLVDNVAVHLGGSLVHWTCEEPQGAAVHVTGNHVEDANRFTDEVMGHSEGVVTFSAHSSDTFARGNTFIRGEEGAFGLLGVDDGVVDSAGNCYAHLARLITLDPLRDADAFHSRDDRVLDVGE